ncbi:unnamed protein product [Urochloa humidicola]
METESVATKMRLDDVEPSSCRICAYKGLDSGSCDFCLAKASALDMIKATGGDSVKAAKDLAASVRSDICVVKVVPFKCNTETAFGGICKTAAEEEGKAKPVGIVRQRKMVPPAYIKRLLTGPPRRAFRPLAEDAFQRQPNLRESLRISADAVLESIQRNENILAQYFQKGYAVMELEIDYGC